MVYMDHSFLIDSSADGHPGCSHGVYGPQLPYPLVCRWASRFLPWCIWTTASLSTPLPMGIQVAPMVYMDHSFLIHSSADWHLGCSHVLAIVNSAAVNFGVHVSLSVLVSFRGMPSRGFAGLYSSCITSFLGNLRTVLHSGWTSVHPHQQCVRFLFSPRLHHSLLLEFLLMAILTSMRWHLIVVLICASLIWLMFHSFD